MRLVKATPAFPQLRDILRRYLAEAQIMLDIAEKDGRIVPIEEPLLQKEVIDRLLPRLANRFPQQEKDLVKAYHDLVQGVDTDAIFILAVKALEEIARKVSGKSKMTLDDLKIIKQPFPICTPRYTPRSSSSPPIGAIKQDTAAKDRHCTKCATFFSRSVMWRCSFSIALARRHLTRHDVGSSADHPLDTACPRCLHLHAYPIRIEQLYVLHPLALHALSCGLLASLLQ